MRSGDCCHTNLLSKISNTDPDFISQYALIGAVDSEESDHLKVAT